MLDSGREAEGVNRVGAGQLERVGRHVRLERDTAWHGSRAATAGTGEHWKEPTEIKHPQRAYQIKQAKVRCETSTSHSFLGMRYP
jgi:hypothetical protein